MLNTKLKAQSRPILNVREEIIQSALSQKQACPMLIKSAMKLGMMTFKENQEENTT
jgi:hypothetical protein